MNGFEMGRPYGRIGSCHCLPILLKYLSTGMTERVFTARRQGNNVPCLRDKEDQSP